MTWKIKFIKMNNEIKSTLFIKIDSMVLRLALPFCKQRRVDLDSFITQAIEQRMESMKVREDEARTYKNAKI